MDFDGRITIMEDGKTNKDGQFPSKTFFYGSNDEFSWVKYGQVTIFRQVICKKNRHGDHT